MRKITNHNYSDFFKDQKGQAMVARVGHINKLIEDTVQKPADPAPGDSLVWNGTEWVAQASTGGGALPYKVYTALLSQSGTDAPIAAVLHNTLGNVVWEYFDLGIYVGRLNGVLIGNKTHFIGSNGFNNHHLYSFSISDDDDTVQVAVTDLDGNYIDGKLYLNSIEIRVYP
jgi:hypothetical protein